MTSRVSGTSIWFQVVNLPRLESVSESSLSLSLITGHVVFRLTLIKRVVDKASFPPGPQCITICTTPSLMRPPPPTPPVTTPWYPGTGPGTGTTHDVP